MSMLSNSGTSNQLDNSDKEKENDITIPSFRSTDLSISKLKTAIVNLLELDLKEEAEALKTKLSLLETVNKLSVIKKSLNKDKSYTCLYGVRDDILNLNYNNGKITLSGMLYGKYTILEEPASEDVSGELKIDINDLKIIYETKIVYEG